LMALVRKTSFISTLTDLLSPRQTNVRCRTSSSLRQKSKSLYNNVFRTPEEIEKIRQENWLKTEMLKKEKEKRQQRHWEKNPPKRSIEELEMI